MKVYKKKVFKCSQLLLTVMLLSIISCSESAKKEDKGIAQGIIEYKIEYPQIPEGNYMLDLMPNEMSTTFKDGNFRSDIVAGMGLFKTSIISEKENENLVHSVKMLNKKYASTLDLEEIRNFNPNFNNIKIVPQSETKKIAGFNCKSFEVQVQGDSSWSFTIYYTKEIDIPAVNQHTPFHEIDGVLMQYEIISYDTHMRFTAQKVIPKDDIELAAIKLEEGYESVSPLQLKQEIESIFAKVK